MATPKRKPKPELWVMRERDGGRNAGYLLTAGKPIFDGFWYAADNEITSFCRRDFEEATGITLKPGQARRMTLVFSRAVLIRVPREA